MADLYRENILDHYRNPRNYGTIENADISYEDSNPLCGDRVRIDMRIEDGKIAEIKFTGRGCAISQASASMLTEMVEGADLDEIRELSAQDILDELGVPISPARVKCALLGLKVLKSAAYGITDWPEH
ncbi:Fe-S cluster assembly sulfur transfer protein SufU [Sphaerobacter sp.]|uniref:Fe-S cluster assembly sulfur transfer protein SufU n=1 Tax=Sphaerobacter sp. TaxID=2099654 RepID=UPI001E042470|nr:SUF system NifU family Fe-S cluster assembly protein [Sphaerobacter sp.]MBX5445686.1 SUF system NifU family Fe-S cluster assembly protein [Sphaerobacter sp.]